MTTLRQDKTAKNWQKYSPLLVPAALLSLASLAWTTWSLVDLLGTGLIGVTVAAGADIIWASVILAEARGLRIGGYAWIVPAIGWAALVVVAVLLAWHGINKGIPAMAVAGPFLPFGAKIVWVLALTDMRDPAALTNEELHQLALMERGMTLEESTHRIEMRRREMGAELLLTEMSTDFDIELMRQDKTRELTRRRPLELEAAVRTHANYANANEANDANGGSEPFARIASDTGFADQANDTANDANTAGQPATPGILFGFSAKPAKANANTRHDANRSPRTANANSTRTPNANDARGANGDPREHAAADYLASVNDGSPISGAELGRRYGKTARWGQKVIAELKNN